MCKFACLYDNMLNKSTPLVITPRLSHYFSSFLSPLFTLFPHNMCASQAHTHKHIHTFHHLSLSLLFYFSSRWCILHSMSTNRKLGISLERGAEIEKKRLLNILAWKPLSSLWTFLSPFLSFHFMSHICRNLKFMLIYDVVFAACLSLPSHLFLLFFFMHYYYYEFYHIHLWIIHVLLPYIWKAFWNF